MIGTLVSHFRLVRELGRGAFGVVYEAEDTRDPEFRVAVKVVHPVLANDPTFRASLRRERRMLDTLDHPGIVRFRDLVETEDSAALVLELLVGHDLHALLDNGPPPLGDSFRIVEGALDALAFCHARGVLHRDLKPANLFVTHDGRVKLMDFGLGKAVEGSKASASGQFTGTYGYAAPEVWHARAHDAPAAAADVYALGLVAWETVVGRPACPEGPLPQRMTWHLDVPLEPASSLRSGVPPWFDPWVAACVAKRSSERLADGAAALELWRALRDGRAPAVGLGTRPSPAPAPVPTPAPASTSSAPRPSAPEASVRAPVAAPAPARPAGRPTPELSVRSPVVSAAPAASSPEAPAVSRPAPPVSSPVAPPPSPSAPPAPPASAPAAKTSAGGLLIALGGLGGVAAVVAVGLVLLSLLCLIAVPNYMAMSLRAQRAEVPGNVDGIKTAEFAYDAAFDGFVGATTRPRADGALDGKLVDWTGSSGFETLGWAPDGQVRGNYEVDVPPLEPGEALATEFTVTGKIDADDDDHLAVYTATKTKNASLDSSPDTY